METSAQSRALCVNIGATPSGRRSPREPRPEAGKARKNNAVHEGDGGEDGGTHPNDGSGPGGLRRFPTLVSTSSGSTGVFSGSRDLREPPRTDSPHHATGGGGAQAASPRASVAGAGSRVLGMRGLAGSRYARARGAAEPTRAKLASFAPGYGCG